MVWLDTEFRVENISSEEGRHGLLHFSFQGCSWEVHSYFESLSFAVICFFSLWSIQDLLSSQWSDSPQNVSFMIFFFHLLCWPLLGPISMKTHVLYFHKFFLHSCIDDSFLLCSLFLKLPLFKSQNSWMIPLILSFLLFTIFFSFFYFFGKCL